MYHLLSAFKLRCLTSLQGHSFLWYLAYNWLFKTKMVTKKYLHPISQKRHRLLCVVTVFEAAARQGIGGAMACWAVFYFCVKNLTCSSNYRIQLLFSLHFFQNKKTVSGIVFHLMTVTAYSSNRQLRFWWVLLLHTLPLPQFDIITKYSLLHSYTFLYFLIKHLHILISRPFYKNF